MTQSVQRIQNYWNHVGQVVVKLGGYNGPPVFLATIEDDFLSPDKKPTVVEALPAVAARCIAGKTHRVATEEEIAEWKAEQAERARLYREIEFSKRPTSVVIGSTEYAERIGALPPGAGNPEPKRTQKGA